MIQSLIDETNALLIQAISDWPALTAIIGLLLAFTSLVQMLTLIVKAMTWLMQKRNTITEIEKR